MPRVQARIDTSIWDDPDFLGLPSSAQRLYLFLLSQPTLQLCGVIPFQPNKWVKKAADLTPEVIVADLAVLEEARFIVSDLDNDELLIRSLMRNDRVSPGNGKLWKAALAQIASVASPRLRATLDEEVARITTGCGIDAASESEDAVSIPHPENEMQHRSGIDTPRAGARASADRLPPTEYRPPSATELAACVERFGTLYVRHAAGRGEKIKHPPALRNHVIAKWGPWVRDRMATGLYPLEKLIDMAYELGEPPQASTVGAP